MAASGTVQHGASCEAAGASSRRETLSVGKAASRGGKEHAAPRRWLGSLRRQLLLLALATTLPFLAFSSAVVLWISGLHREATHQGLETTTRALALTLDKQIEIYQATAAALATSPSLETGDGAALYKQADGLARRLGVWISVSLSSGQQIVNTLRPFEVELPHAGTIEASVIWNSGEYYGCQFALPITPAALSAALLQADGHPPAHAAHDPIAEPKLLNSEVERLAWKMDTALRRLTRK